MLQPIVDFIYTGETLITNDELNVFLETGKELHIKGLDSDLTGSQERQIISENLSDPLERNNYPEEKMSTVSVEENADNNVVIKEENLLPQSSNNEISLQINEMIEKNEEMWRCRMCGKTAMHKGNLKQHIELHHLEGMAHDCHICNKTFLNRHNLRYHLSNIHSELLSCEICGKIGMTKNAQR